mmetsp:Transcript_331/g.1002  ORF Transcript_331/g.1002 Transcript_331/m.1002 type:complete len:99 (-) Transcript_331:1676-1972(-)
MRKMNAIQDTTIPACLKGCEDLLTVMKDCQEALLMSQQLKHTDKAADMQECIVELQQIIRNRIDVATAQLLQHNDMYAVDSSEPTNVQVRLLCLILPL